jgi:hypothetical protein
MIIIQKIGQLQGSEAINSCPSYTIDIMDILESVLEAVSSREARNAGARFELYCVLCSSLFQDTKRFSRCQLTSQLLLQPCSLSSSFVPFFIPFPL